MLGVEMDTKTSHGGRRRSAPRGHSEVSESVAVEVLRVPHDDLRFEKMRAFTCRRQERGAPKKGRVCA